MHVLVVILLTVSIFSFVRAGGQLSLFKHPAKEDDVSSKRIFILADNGPNYLDPKSFKIIPVTSTAINRRTSRRNSQHGGRFSIQKYSEQGSSRRVDVIPLNRKIKIASIPTYQQALRRNENSNNPDIASVLWVKTSDGISAVPVTTPQKDNADSPLRQNNKYIQINTNVDKNKLPTSDQNVKQSESLNEKQVNTIQPEASSVKKLTGWVYPLKNNHPIPVESSNPEPYDFGYDINDGLGSTQFRRESTNGDGVITGNYGYKDYQGVFRHVSYVSDKDGFRTVVRSNEPSVLPVDSADVTVIVDPPPPFFISSKS